MRHTPVNEVTPRGSSPLDFVTPSFVQEPSEEPESSPEAAAPPAAPALLAPLRRRPVWLAVPKSAASASLTSRQLCM
eukprot:scaffold53820_cov75-Phaeocystis_antarctica.AAC.1